MKTTSQVAALTGISTRTLQYYDEIDLLKPSELTSSGYRLYNDEALEKLQQILFFKELGFQLREIKNILEKPEFDKLEAFKKQKELLLLRRSRTDRLIQLLSRLEKGEQCMSFKEFDLTDYIESLEQFKGSNRDDIIKGWGSLDNFDLFIQKIRDDESKIAQLAIKEFGSVENYTAAMKYNLEHFSETMEKMQSGVTGDIIQQSNDLYQKLTADMKRDVSSGEVQDDVREIVSFIQKNSTASSLEKSFWDMLIGLYSSNEYEKTITDTKYGAGASDYIAQALQYYFRDNS